jgi:hypothetical protein
LKNDIKLAAQKEAAAYAKEQRDLKQLEKASQVDSLD